MGSQFIRRSERYDLPIITEWGNSEFGQLSGYQTVDFMARWAIYHFPQPRLAEEWVMGCFKWEALPIHYSYSWVTQGHRQNLQPWQWFEPPISQLTVHHTNHYSIDLWLKTKRNLSTSAAAIRLNQQRNGEGVRSEMNAIKSLLIWSVCMQCAQRKACRIVYF